MDYRVFDISVGSGRLGIGPMPGRTGFHQSDLATIVRWGADVVLTMNPVSELKHADADGMGQDLQALGVIWHHLPIPDFGAPPPETASAWPVASQDAHTALQKGGRVFAHCWGGCGRSGMALLRLMVEAGEPAEDALRRLRQVRPCAVETGSQFDWARDG